VTWLTTHKPIEHIEFRYVWLIHVQMSHSHVNDSLST